MRLEHLDVLAGSPALAQVEPLVGFATRSGCSALWTTESRRTPFLPLALASQMSTSLTLGTGIAVAFARSPMVTAMDAWEIQRASNGRFILGLGTQVRRHIEHRFSADFERPAARIREYVLALRELFAAFSGERELNFHGEFFTLDYLTPTFDPGPIPVAPPPIYLAAVGSRMATVAGEVADGVWVHPFHTVQYIETVFRPAVEQAAQASGRHPTNLTFATSVLCVTGRDRDERRESEREIRQQIGFYGSTKAYRPILEAHGWGALQDELAGLVRAGRWKDLGSAVPLEVLEAMAVIADPDELGDAILARYGDVVERISLYFPLDATSGVMDPQWQPALRRVAEQLDTGGL